MKRGRVAWIGLVVAATGCVDRGGFGLDDETSGDPTGGDDPTAEDDPGDEEGPNDIPLELVLVNLNATGQFLLLRFSEPMAPVDTVDPSDFRISFARTVTYTGYYGEYSWSFYADPGTYYTYNYEPSPMVVTKVAAGKKETDIVLRFETALNPQVCDWLVEIQEIFDNDPSQQGQVALFVHYSPGGVPVESVDGEVLSAIGPDWVEYDSSFMSVDTYGWPNLEPQLPIPCNL